MDGSLIESLARELYDAEISRRPVAVFTGQFPEMTNEDAYQIQLAGMDSA